jgi:Fe-Mn family superoxide dismutase
MVSRRSFLISAAGGTVALALPRGARGQTVAGFQLPSLPYDYSALEPHIDARTMNIHHTKHHQAYVDKLNAALMSGASDWLSRPIADVVANYRALPESIQTAVRNQGGGHLNHSQFWKMMAKPGTGGQPSAELAQAIQASFGGMDGFKQEFLAKATGQFGSGWAWLIRGKDRPLAVVSTANQDNPISDGQVAILGIDVWEHAYYLKYQNQRPVYVEAWFNVIHWNYVNELFEAA